MSDLLECYKLISIMGWDDSLYTHFSVRSSSDKFYTARFGIPFNKLRQQDIIEVQIREKNNECNPSALASHSHIYSMNKHVGAILHTHSIDGSAVAAEGKLSKISQYSILINNSTAFHEYRGLLFDDGEDIARLTLNHDFIILKNHGLLTVGRNHKEVLMNMYMLENACSIQVRSKNAQEVSDLSPKNYKSVLRFFAGKKYVDLFYDHLTKKYQQ